MHSASHAVMLKTGAEAPTSAGFCILLKPGLTPEVTFAVPTALTRQCRLFSTVLDDLDLLTENASSEHDFPEIILPAVNAATCQAVFKFLELTTIRVPSMIARPLRAPISELTQPWEMEYILSECLDDRDAAKHDKLIQVMVLADYLMIDPLRDLTCAFLASSVTQCESEGALHQLLGVNKPPTDDELAPVYEQFPFLKL